MVSKSSQFMFCAAAVCAVRLAACVWPEEEQATALNETTIWYEEWLVISVMCKSAWLLKLTLCMSIRNSTPPLMSITGLETSPDVLF